MRCTGGSSTPPPALLGSNSLCLHRPIALPLLSLPLSWLLIICLLAPVLGGTFIPLTAHHQFISPPIYPSHNELLGLHYVPILLHQPSGEAPARLETRGRGGEVGGKGCGLFSEETKEEERGNGGAGESPQLPRAA